MRPVPGRIGNQAQPVPSGARLLVIAGIAHARWRVPPARGRPVRLLQLTDGGAEVIQGLAAKQANDGIFSSFVPTLLTAEDSSLQRVMRAGRWPA